MNTGERAFKMDGLEPLRGLDQGEMFALTLATLSIKCEKAIAYSVSEDWQVTYFIQ